MSSNFNHWWENQPKFLFYLLLLTLAIATVGCSFLGGNSTTQTTPTAQPTYIPSGMPRVQGTQIVDATRHPFLLHGAQIESPFNYIKDWEKGKRPTDNLTSATFNAMAHDWHMNALRLPISNWIYTKYTSEYMSQLDQVVQRANAARLYVVLDLHDNIKSGSPYSDNSDMPKPENVTFWKAIATHYRSNPMIMFDVFNEPHTRGWNTWLHGGGTTPDGVPIVGFQDLVNAIRSVGAQQIIVVEPGAAGGKGNGVNGAAQGGWSNFPLADAINDPEIMYSLHVYEDIILPPDRQKAKWGPVLNHFPLYYGEWAFLPNANGTAHCRSLPTDPNQADQVVLNFLNFMASIHASWTAWSFTPHHLVQDYKSYAPTTLNTPWTCGNPKVNAGMGMIVKQYLASNS